MKKFEALMLRGLAFFRLSELLGEWGIMPPS